MADSAEEAFKQLSDTHTRFDFFKRILPSLTSQDVRNLRSALSACTLQFDIAGSLPTELFVEVFKYLDTHDAIRLEFVCKRWNALLSNPALLQQILGTDIASPKAPLRNEPANMTSSVLRRRRERRRALRVCEPVWLGRYTRSAKYGRWNVAAKKVDFCQGVIAAILPHDGSRSTGDVEIIDLCSGNNHRHLLCLQSSYWRTSGFPSSIGLQVDRVTIWNWNTRVLRVIAIKNPASRYLDIIVAPNATSITVFSHMGKNLGTEDRTVNDYVEFNTYNMDGILIASGKTMFTSDPYLMYRLLMKPCNTEGQYAVAIVDGPRDLSAKHERWIIFDENTLSFNYRLYSIPPLVDEQATEAWFLWRSTVYGILDKDEEDADSVEETMPSMRVTNYNFERKVGELVKPAVTVNKAQPQRRKIEPHDIYGLSYHASLDPNFDHKLQDCTDIFGNDSFLVLLHEGYEGQVFDILCFEPGINSLQEGERFSLKTFKSLGSSRF